MNYPTLGIALIAALYSLSAAAYDPKAGPNVDIKTGEWWNEAYPQSFDAKQLANPQSEIKVQGKNLVDAAGNTVILRGVNIGDPDKLAKQGHWDKRVFEGAKSFGANVIRLPIHPIAWRSRGASEYLKLIDQAVIWANELNIYLIVDWHSMGNITKELYFHPMYVTNQQETREFWRTVANRYAGISTIAVYELFNEPTTNGGKLGEVDWNEWKLFNEELISIIQAHDKNIISLVAGFNWAYDLSKVKEAPVARDQVAYAIHPYPQKVKDAPLATTWEKQWGYIADTYPIMATELGWMREGEKGAHVPVINDGSYGPIISQYLEQRGISFTVWCFDPDWPPQMISDWNFTPTEQGKFFKDYLLNAAKRDKKTEKHKK